MRNAKKFDDRIAIGGVPDSEDLAQLKELGYKTIIDLRDEEEKFGGLVEKRAINLGLKYLKIPIYREAIKMEEVVDFFNAVYEKGSAPIYAFSRFGKRPLAFLLLFEAVAKSKDIHTIFVKASKFGLNLEGDLSLRSFLVEFYNSGCVEPIVESIRKLRPDLFNK
jgi:uncharacterized protein (TIGR01244 family)